MLEKVSDMIFEKFAPPIADNALFEDFQCIYTVFDLLVLSEDFAP